MPSQIREVTTVLVLEIQNLAAEGQHAAGIMTVQEDQRFSGALIAIYTTISSNAPPNPRLDVFRAIKMLLYLDFRPSRQM